MLSRLTGLALLSLVACGPSASPTPASNEPPPAPATDGGNDAAGAACADLHARLGASLEDDLAPATVTSHQQAPAAGVGVALAVLTPECGLWEHAAGTSRPNDPLRADHLLWAGSVTKTFVAAAVAKLAEVGALSLDDRLSVHVPSFPGASGITLRQLLGHTSGIFNYTSDPEFEKQLLAAPARVWRPQELLDIAAAHPADFAPGSGWAYSNTNYVLAALVIEKVTGAPLRDVLRTRLFEPAGLKQTYFERETAIPDRRAHGWDGQGRDVTDVFDMSWGWGAGGVLSTPGDLARWARELYEGRVLDEMRTREILDIHDTSRLTPFRYGLGVMEFSAKIAGERAIGHKGDQPGYHTQMLYFPDRRTSVVAIVNSDLADASVPVQGVLEILQGKRPKWP